MTAIPARARQRMIVALCCGLAAAIALPAGLVVGMNAVLNERGGVRVVEPTTLRIPATPAALLGVRNAAGEVTALWALALATDGVGGTIVSVPAKAAPPVAEGEAPRRLADGHVGGDPAALVADAEALLGVTFAVAAVVDRDALAAMLDPVGAVEVVLDSDVRRTEPDGSTAVVAKAGRRTVDAGVLADVLTSREIDQPESARANHQRSVLAAVASGAGNAAARGAAGAADAGVPRTIEAFVARLLGGTVQTWQLSATAVPRGDGNPDGLDLYALDPAEVLLVMASVAPTSLVAAADEDAPRVQIDSPLNDPLASREAVRRLAELGFAVVLVREVPGPAPSLTRLELADGAAAARLEDVVARMGDAETASAVERTEGVDVRVVLGESFATFVAAARS
ncbi:MAG: LCP family protein [Ilumatobacteraceae bacterium]